MTIRKVPFGQFLDAFIVFARALKSNEYTRHFTKSRLDYKKSSLDFEKSRLDFLKSSLDSRKDIVSTQKGNSINSVYNSKKVEPVKG